METWIISLIALAFTAAGSVLAWLIFWLRFSDAIGKARGRAEAAREDAIEAKKLSDEAHTRITALDHMFGLYRERVAMDYVSRSSMSELEARLVKAIDAVGGKLDQVLAYERKQL